MGISIIIPYKKDKEYQGRIFGWNVRRYEEIVCPYLKDRDCDFELILEEDTHNIFYKTRILNRAVNKANKEILLFADMDMVFDPEILMKGIEAASKHKGIIHLGKYLHRLTRKKTEEILMGNVDVEISITEEDSELTSSIMPAGLVVLLKESFYKVNEMDERFYGWGAEDSAFNCAMVAIVEQSVRIEGDVYHLWHPREKQQSIAQGHFERNRRLYRRYARLIKDKKNMLKLVNEDKNKMR